ncbi:hypothetical protein N657DRAFT_689920 [Parathielavia appendiculata]|uniref:Uncharacterized protein n=1 Tax=Parathielavia appendiculata TaxID=2587402 RepID=A0AAN6Z3X9_9PEZI|nr:hypothetical protein N657DRAFT_689920 [Parathielavia appendiculata]
MESKFSDSSSKIGSTKRGFSDEAQESPTENQAKRAKHNKKRRSKSERDPDGYVEQQDLISFDQTSALFSPIAHMQKQTPIKPPAPFPFKEAHRAYVQKSAEITKEALGGESKKNVKESLKQPTAQDNPKTEANTRKKVRAEPSVNKTANDRVEDANSKITGVTAPPKEEHISKKRRKRPNRHERPQVPAVAGPSKPKATDKPAPAPKELTPLSDITAPVDYSFKAYPDPPPVQFLPFTKSRASREAQNGNTKAPNATPVDDIPKNTITAIEPNILPIPEAALATPAGTKTLKIINKHLKALEETINGHPSQLNNTCDALRADIAKLHERLSRDELRASIRHAIIFNALIKVSCDLCALNGRADKHQQQHDEHDNDHPTVPDGGETHKSATTAPGKDKDKDREAAIKDKDRLDSLKSKKARSIQQARKTLEQCLRIYTEDMNRAASTDEVARYGVLCVQYAGDLFKTLG